MLSLLRPLMYPTPQYSAKVLESQHRTPCTSLEGINPGHHRDLQCVTPARYGASTLEARPHSKEFQWQRLPQASWLCRP